MGECGSVPDFLCPRFLASLATFPLRDTVPLVAETQKAYASRTSQLRCGGAKVYVLFYCHMLNMKTRSVEWEKSQV